MKQRVAKWDNLKFILILLVVVGHFLDYYETGSLLLKGGFLFIYSFHIPAFLFVSGLMSKKTVDTTPFRVQRAMSLFALYLLCNGLVLAVRLLAGKTPSVGLFGQDHYSWFMFVLPVFYLLTHILRSLPPAFLLGFSVVAGCLAGYDPAIGDGWYLSRILVLYPFFLAGYYLDGQKILQVLDKKWVRLTGFVVLGVALFLFVAFTEELYFLRPLMTARNPFEKIDIPYELGGLIRLGYYAVSGLLIAAVVAVTPTGKTFFTTLGTRTLQVYVLHRPILFLLQDLGLCQRLQTLLPTTVWWAVYFASAVALTFLLSARWLEPPFAYLMNPKGQRI